MELASATQLGVCGCCKGMLLLWEAGHSWRTSIPPSACVSGHFPPAQLMREKLLPKTGPASLPQGHSVRVPGNALPRGEGGVEETHCSLVAWGWQVKGDGLEEGKARGLEGRGKGKTEAWGVERGAGRPRLARGATAVATDFGGQLRRKSRKCSQQPTAICRRSHWRSPGNRAFSLADPTVPVQRHSPSAWKLAGRCHVLGPTESRTGPHPLALWLCLSLIGGTCRSGSCVRLPELHACVCGGGAFV